MADKILTFKGKTISGPSGTGMAIVRGPATMTIRFKFTNDSTSDPYNPTEEPWSKGSWTFIESGEDEDDNPYTIWEWTYTGANASNAFKGKFSEYLYYTEIVNMNCTSEITNVSGLFYGCTYMISVTDAYTQLSRISPNYHTDCFKNCGLGLSSSAQEMVSIPEDWGGLKPLTGRGIKIGNSVWDNESIGLVSIPDIVEIEPDQMFEHGTIGYMEYDGITYYTVDAIKYLIAHQELLPSGWHIPTQDEALDFYYNIPGNAKPVFNTTGTNGFNVPTTKPDDNGGTIEDDYDGMLEFENGEWGLRVYSYDNNEFLHNCISYPAIDAIISFETSYGTIDINRPSQQWPDPYHFIEDNMIPVRLVRN